ncbi:hypothetical protein Hamer_G003918, partial [Homarus americanus]
LDKADWDLYKEIVKEDRSSEEFPFLDEALEYITSLLQWADKVSSWTTDHDFRFSPLKTVAMHFSRLRGIPTR